MNDIDVLTRRVAHLEQELGRSRAVIECLAEEVRKGLEQHRARWDKILRDYSDEYAKAVGEALVKMVGDRLMLAEEAIARLEAGDKLSQS